MQPKCQNAFVSLSNFGLFGPTCGQFLTIFRKYPNFEKSLLRCALRSATAVFCSRRPAPDQLRRFCLSCVFPLTLNQYMIIIHLAKYVFQCSHAAQSFVMVIYIFMAWLLYMYVFCKYYETLTVQVRMDAGISFTCKS